MKTKLLICLILITTAICTQAQEFVDTIYFRDAVGNRDTIIIGYDPMATDTIDTIFGEKDISALPYDTVFSVRVSNQWDGYNYPKGYKSKKSIVRKLCPNITHRKYFIYLVCKNFPVSISWNNIKYKDSCTIRSLITSAPDIYWFDIGSNQYDFLKDNESIILDKDDWYTHWNRLYDKLYDSVGPNIITNYHLLIGVGSYDAYSKRKELKNAVNIFPNPCLDKLQINSLDKLKSIEVYNNLGIKLKIYTVDGFSQTIDLSTFNNEIYFIRVINENNEYSIHKILKQ